MYPMDISTQVPFHGQGSNNNYCGPASAKMCLEGYPPPPPPSSEPPREQAVAVSERITAKTANQRIGGQG